MPRHKFTPAETAKGIANHGKSRLQIARQLKKLTGMEIEGALIETLLGNTTLVNTAIFIGVAELWNPGQVANNVGSSGAAVGDFTSWLKKLLFTPGGEFVAIGQAVGAATPSLAKDLLLVSLAANIASGGNLAGTLSSATGFISKLLPAAAAAV